MITRMLLGIFSLMFVVFGLGFVLWPEGFTPLFLGISSPGGDLLVDMRATYGGISLALGLFTGYCVVRGEHVHPALVLAFLVSLGLLAGRSVGLLEAADAGPFMYNSLVFEAALTALYGGLLLGGARLHSAGMPARSEAQTGGFPPRP